MPKGGARVNSGPPPDPNALRRDRKTDQAGWTTLPAEGFAGRVPAWPLSKRIQPNTDDPDADKQLAEAVGVQEAAHWRRAWRTPQAVAWHQLGWTHDVALYCRHLAMAELGDMRAASEARQWSDRLGLNPAAMLRNRWRIAVDQVAEKRGQRAAAPASGRPSARERFKAVSGGGGA